MADVNIEKLKDSIRAVYSFSGVGSALHIVLDDVNVEDEHVAWCLENSIPELTDPREKWACVECATLLLQMPFEKRKELVDGHGWDWK